jgi:hypothetical protein
MKIRLWREEDRNKNEQSFDFAIKQTAAPFLQISDRVAARTILFSSRLVAVYE